MMSRVAKLITFQTIDEFLVIRSLLGRSPSVLCPFLSFEAEILSSGIKSSFLSLSWSHSKDFRESKVGDASKDSNSVLERTTMAVSATTGMGDGRTDCEERTSLTPFLSSEGMGPYIVKISGIPFFPSHCSKASLLSCLPSAMRIKLNLCLSSSSRLVCCSFSSLSTKYLCLFKYHSWLANIRAHTLCAHTRAIKIGVCPLMSMVSILAPHFISSWRHFTCPSLAAWWTGVIPVFVCL